MNKYYPNKFFIIRLEQNGCKWPSEDELLTEDRYKKIRRRLVLVLVLSLVVVSAGIAGIIVVLAGSYQTFSTDVVITYEITTRVDVVTSYAFDGDSSWTVLNGGNIDSLSSSRGATSRTLTDFPSFDGHKYVVFEFMCSAKRLEDIGYLRCTANTINGTIKSFGRSFVKLGVGELDDGVKGGNYCYISPYSAHGDETIYMYYKLEFDNKILRDFDTNVTINLSASIPSKPQAYYYVYNRPDLILNNSEHVNDYFLGCYNGDTKYIDHHGFAIEGYVYVFDEYGSFGLKSTTPRYVSKSATTFDYNGWRMRKDSSYITITGLSDRDSYDYSYADPPFARYLTDTPFDLPINRFSDLYISETHKNYINEITQDDSMVLYIPNTITYIYAHTFDDAPFYPIFIPSGTWQMDGGGTVTTQDGWISDILETYSGSFTKVVDQGLGTYISPGGVEYTFDGTYYHVVDIPSTVNEIDCLPADTVNWVFGQHPVASINTLYMAGIDTLRAVRLPSDIEVEDDEDGFNFTDCTNLVSVTIPSCFNTLEIGCFANCTSLTSLTIPSTISSIECEFLYDCPSLESIAVEAGNLCYTSINNCLIDIANKTIIATAKNCTIPTSSSVVDTIDEHVEFYGSGYLLLPNNITTIGSSVSFYYDAVLYTGSATEWSNVDLSDHNNWENSILYCYSETQPVSGKYWHYVNGVPTIW